MLLSRSTTPPRRIVEGATFAICRRTERRRFLLRPDALFLWLLAVCVEPFGIEVHAATCLSTHFHLVVTVPNAHVSDFLHRLDTHLARAVQVLRRFVGGVVWAPGQLSIVELTRREAVVEQIVYAFVKPLKPSMDPRCIHRNVACQSPRGCSLVVSRAARRRRGPGSSRRS
ncbi:MAG TPA: hypothetical protein RMH99_19825 [Sandaracinaceae bacterium LLY-WYZ-13_1]|nr:hypothetical protein [Sandaracinaceae bacterium LLY-WYZ-13_1]